MPAGPGLELDVQAQAADGAAHGVTGRLYVDGAEVGSASAPSGTPWQVNYVDTTDTRLSFGRYVEPGGGCDQNGFQYSGGIDDVRLYSRALSGAEIGSVEGFGGPGTGPSTPPPPEITNVQTVPVKAVGKS